MIDAQGPWRWDSEQNSLKEYYIKYLDTHVYENSDQLNWFKSHDKHVFDVLLNSLHLKWFWC